LNALDPEDWMARCARRLMALDPDSPLDGTDWDDIAGDLFNAASNLEPEWIAATFIAMTTEAPP